MNPVASEAIDRRQLIGLAYRMTGEVAVSEDIVHDLVENWLTHPKPDIQHVAAYLAKAVTNRCLTYLASVKRQRELYRGTWLPEPVVTEPFGQVDTRIDLSYGFVVLLAKLTPAERAVFLLKESFDMEYSELADLLSLSQVNCRQLFHRAQTRLAGSRKRFPVSLSQQQALLSAFVSAIQSGNVSAFIELLKQEITLYADGGGKMAAPLRPLVGIGAVSSFLQGLIRKGFITYDVKPVNVNATIGFLLFTNPHNQLDTVLCMELDNGYVDAIYLVRNPDKLGHLTDSD